MKDIRFYLTFMALLLFLPLGLVEVDARSVRDVWINMPDSIVPYLGGSQRVECVDFYEMHSKAETSNMLGGKSHIDTMTVNFLQATLTKSSVMQMKLLPASNGRDSVVCLVRSYLAPERESRVTLYTLDWKPIGHVDFCADEYIARPDTMTAERFEYLKTFLDPVMFSVELVPNENSMVVGLTTNAVGVEDKKALDSILVQRKLTWNGEIFK